jgi:hypothetical protein
MIEASGVAELEQAEMRTVEKVSVNKKRNFFIIKKKVIEKRV